MNLQKKKFLILPVLFIAMLFTGCKKDSNSPTASTFSAVISSGTWNITSFTQKSENNTSDFTGMDFAFSGNGNLTVSGTASASGTWSYSPAVTGSYGSSSTIATFTINILSGSSFSKLSRTWNVGANSATSLQLDHPEASEDEHVVFTKK